MDEKTKIYLEAEWEKLSAGQEQTLTFLKQHGFLPDEREWLTIKRYAQKYEMTVEQVTIWIDSGVIPAACVAFLNVAGGIRVIQDQPYRSKS